METTLLEEGVILMLVGMSTVFAFLGLMVGAMHLSARVFQALARWLPQEAAPASSLERLVEDQADVAAVLAVVTHFEKKK